MAKNAIALQQNRLRVSIVEIVVLLQLKYAMTALEDNARMIAQAALIPRSMS